MSNVDTSDAMLPGSPGSPIGRPHGPVDPAARRRRRWAWIGGVTGVLVTAAIAASLLVPLPYYALKPGAVRSTETAISIEGAPFYESEGEIDFTTVSVRQLTVVEWVQAWLDTDIAVRSEEQLFGSRSAEENRQFNIQQMDTSKLDAVRVALVHLGYEVPITVTGQIVVQVNPGTPADGTLEVGDVIVRVGETEITGVDSLTEALEPTRPGDRVVLGVEDPTSGGVRQVELVLGERTDGLEQGFIGVGLAPRDLVYDFPFEVIIDSGNVGGPSAGLAFTLAVLDALTPGELTGGFEVAVTGTILADGRVGPVGGVEQKAAAVRDAGITLFLVPVGEGEEARESAGDAVRVVEVSSLEEALVALDSLGGNALDLENTSGSEAALAGD